MRLSTKGVCAYGKKREKVEERRKDTRVAVDRAGATGNTVDAAKVLKKKTLLRGNRNQKKRVTMGRSRYTTDQSCH